MHTGHVTEDVMELCRGVPARTLRSWQKRFADTADALTSWLSALCVEWGGLVPTYPAEQADRAISAIVAVSKAVQRRRSDAPPAWILASVITDGQVMANRVDLPRPGVGSRLPSNHKGKVVTCRSHQKPASLDSS